MNRLTPLMRTLSNVSRTGNITIVRSMGADVIPKHIQDMETNAHYDRVPIPQGSWQEQHNKRNSKYNLMLAASILTLGVTAYVMYESGCLYLHREPKKVNK